MLLIRSIFVFAAAVFYALPCYAVVDQVRHVSCKLKEATLRTDGVVTLIEKMVSAATDTSALVSVALDVSSSDPEAEVVAGELVSYFGNLFENGLLEDVATLKDYSRRAQRFLNNSLSDQVLAAIDCGSEVPLSVDFFEHNNEIDAAFRSLADFVDMFFLVCSNMDNKLASLLGKITSTMYYRDTDKQEKVLPEKEAFLGGVRKFASRGLVTDLYEIKAELLGTITTLMKVEDMLADWAKTEHESTMMMESYDDKNDANQAIFTKEDKDYRYIVTLLKANNLVEAESKCYEFLQKFKNSIHVHDCNYWIGEIAYSKGLTNKAYEFFEKYVTQSTKYDHRMGSALIKMLDLLIRTGSMKKACKKFAFTSTYDLPKYIARQLETRLHEINCIE